MTSADTHLSNNSGMGRKCWKTFQVQFDIFSNRPKIRETAAVHEMKEMMTTTHSSTAEPRPNEN